LTVFSYACRRHVKMEVDHVCCLSVKRVGLGWWIQLLAGLQLLAPDSYF